MTPAWLAYVHNEGINELIFIDRESPFVGTEEHAYNPGLCSRSEKELWEDYLKVRPLNSNWEEKMLLLKLFKGVL